MLLGVTVWVVFQAAFVGALATESVALIFLTYMFRGFGFPLFAFAFLVWVNAVSPKERAGAARRLVLRHVHRRAAHPRLPGRDRPDPAPSAAGIFGERWAMVASTAIVVAGFLIAYFGVREEHGDRRLAPRARPAGR